MCLTTPSESSFVFLAGGRRLRFFRWSANDFRVTLLVAINVLLRLCPCSKQYSSLRSGHLTNQQCYYFSTKIWSSHQLVGVSYFFVLELVPKHLRQQFLVSRLFVFTRITS